jgi:hypothetical protein
VLTSPEFSFRNMVKLHLDKLLSAQCKYLIKRCYIRWNKVGEDNTKKIHAMASQRYMKNTIASLKSD